MFLVSTIEVTPEPVHTQRSIDSNKRRSTSTKQPSYLQATSSSKAKNSAETGTKPSSSASSSNVSSGGSKKPNTLRRGRLSNQMKAKFKSTPDLAAIDAEPSVLVPAGSHDDLDIDTKTTDAKKAAAQSSRSNRRSMLVTSTESRDYNSTSSRSSEERDRSVMPPPAAGFVPPESRKTSAPELTLAQAKEILLGGKKEGQKKEAEKKALERRTRLRNKSPSRQLPSTPVTANGVSQKDVPQREKSHSVSTIVPRRLNSVSSPPTERKIPEETSPSSNDSTSPGKRSIHSDSLDETPVKGESNLNVAGSLSGALTTSPASRPGQLNLHIPREGSPDDVRGSTTSLNRPNRLSRAFSPLKSILKGGRKKEKEEVHNGEAPVKEGDPQQPLPIDVLGNITWKKAHTQDPSTSPQTSAKSPDHTQSRLSRNREMLSKVLMSPPLPSSSPPSTATASPRSSLSSVGSDVPQTTSSSSTSPQSQAITSPTRRTGTEPRAISPPTSSPRRSGNDPPPLPTSSPPVSSPPGRRWSSNATNNDAAAAADARGKWDLALQQQQSTVNSNKRGASPRRISAPSASGLTFAVAAPVPAAIPATSSPVAVHSVTTVSSTKAEPVVLAASVKETVQQEEEVTRYDKSRQSPPISLTTTVSEKVVNRYSTIFQQMANIMNFSAGYNHIKCSFRLNRAFCCKNTPGTLIILNRL